MKLTALETKVLKAIKECIENEFVYCCHVTAIGNYCDLTIHQIKGCIGSMIKKKAVQGVHNLGVDYGFRPVIKKVNGMEFRLLQRNCDYLDKQLGKFLKP